MSDCSTQAFKAHEKPEMSHKQISGTPKTCGTCDAYFEVRPTMKQGTCGYDELDDEGCAPLHDSDDSCEMWNPQSLTLEERYQQLEHVAVAMQKCLATHAHDWTQVSDYTAAYYRNQLEALGVSVDE